MRICPKCQKVYGIKHLEFCSVDGVPLVEVFNENALREGQKILERSDKLLKRKQRIASTRKAFGYVVTTVIFSSVIFVIAANTIVYLKPKNDDQVKRELPNDKIEFEVINNSTLDFSMEDLKDKLIEKPSVSPIAKLTPTPIVENSPNILKTKTPIELPTPKSNQSELPKPTPAQITPTPAVTPKPTPEVSPTPAEIPTLIKCSNTEKEKAKIRNKLKDVWHKQAKKELRQISQKNLREGERTSNPKFSGQPNSVILLSSDCSEATVTVNYNLIFRRNGKAIVTSKKGIYYCTKSKSWKCKRR